VVDDGDVQRGSRGCKKKKKRAFVEWNKKGVERRKEKKKKKVAVALPSEHF
jgi:hypothetical protein